MWTSVDESLDDCKQMQISVDESEIFSLIQKKVTMIPFSCCCNYATVAKSVCKFSIL